MATDGALANALVSGDIWVPTSRMHQSLDVLLAPSPDARLQLPFSLSDPHALLYRRAEQFDSASRDAARNLDARDAALFAGERLRFPKEQKVDDGGQDEGRHLSSPVTACCLPRVSPTCCPGRTLDWLYPAFQSRFKRVTPR